MKNIIPNPIIVIGSDHYNTLAVVRCLGLQMCDVTALIIGSFSDVSEVCVARSKYVRNKTFCTSKDEDVLIARLLKLKNAKIKTILLPTNDFAAYVVDKRFHDLEKDFIIPGFYGSPGRVIELMDKWNQVVFARENNIPMARSWKIEREENQSFILSEEVEFPCIVKPIISAFGSKSDISVVHSKKELLIKLQHLESYGYRRLLIQSFLKKEYESTVFGSVFRHSTENVVTMVRKIRENGGTSSFNVIEENVNIRRVANKILDILKTQGYCGLIDIEFLVCKGAIYLNEINFRHSGLGVELIANGFNSPYLTCLDILGKTVPPQKDITVAIKKRYYMHEIGDLYHVKHRQCSIFHWLRDFIRTRIFAFWNLQDLVASFAFYRKYIKGNYKHSRLATYLRCSNRRLNSHSLNSKKE